MEKALKVLIRSYSVFVVNKGHDRLQADSWSDTQSSV